MTRVFYCSNCGQPIKGKFSKAGEVIICPKCKTDVTIPDFAVTKENNIEHGISQCDEKNPLKPQYILQELTGENINDKSSEMFSFILKQHKLTFKREKDTGLIYILKDNEIYAKYNEKETKNKLEFNINSDKITFQYKKDKSLLFLPMTFDHGFKIWINDIPVKESAAHPLTRIKNASYTFYLLAVINLFILILDAGYKTIVREKISSSIIIYILIESIIYLLLGLGTKKSL